MELSCNTNFLRLSLFDVLLNFIIYIILEIIFVNLFINRSVGLALLYGSVFIVGVANHFVIEFRKSPIMASDIFSIQTAWAVSGQYTYKINDGILVAMLLLCIVLSLLSALSHADITKKIVFRREKVLRPLVSLITMLILYTWISLFDFETQYGIGVNLWRPLATYQNTGFATAFITYLQKMKIKEPENYSAATVAGILDNYMSKDSLPIAECQENPTIIAIMNEAFSDISVLGPMNGVEKDLEFLNSLKEDSNTIEFGYNYVSTRGGGTATTEFEFLTGNSISNIQGANPYAQFNFENVPTMAQNLKQQGYRTIAMHPEDPNNWRRNYVYPNMGFDEFLSMEDFAGYDTTTKWNRISDLGNYKKVIDIYEKQTSPSFIFNVTMQNHSSYEIDAIDTGKLVDIDEEYKRYTDVQAYQSMINEADQALEYLINYFKDEDKPVILCFFGDHQPSLNPEFEEKLINKGRTETDSELSIQEKYYVVPYFIWSNYGVQPENQKENSDGISIMSTNYLGVTVQKYAGLQLSAYNKYLMDQRDEIPVINYIGYYASDSQWHSLDEKNSFWRWISEYNLIQYNAMFDNKRKNFYYIIQ